MSLILTTRFNKGILLASDSFIFDNDGEVPSKSMSFDKILVSAKYKTAMVAVGSSWVFHQANEWLKSKEVCEDILSLLTTKWRELNGEWKRKREKEISETENKTLRPVSDSLCVIAKQSDLENIHIIDPEGKLHKTQSFVMSGSGADLVRQFLKSEQKSFKTSDSVEKSLELVQQSYKYASHDLYVTGFPAVAIVTSEKMTNLTNQCKNIWDECENKYFDDLITEVRNI